ncbi:MAG: DedA family protein [Caulobacteraceae bacterium]|nr:DedA family protein [Caulobacter sp.]
MLRRLYDRVIRLAETRWALPALAAVSFAEASFFPVPPDVLLAPMVLARRERAWLYALVCTVASVLGALLGYAIGFYVGRGVIAALHMQAGFAKYEAAYQHWGVWVILVKGLTPIPFKLVTIASGVFRFALLPFLSAAALTRAVRFFLVAALLQHPRAKAFVDDHLGMILGAAALALVAALVATRFL